MIISKTAHVFDRKIADKIAHVAEYYAFANGVLTSVEFTASNYLNKDCTAENCVRRLFLPRFRTVPRPASPRNLAETDPLIACLLQRNPLNKYLTCLKRKRQMDAAGAELEASDCEFVFRNLLDAYHVDESVAFTKTGAYVSDEEFRKIVGEEVELGFAKTDEQVKWSKQMRVLADQFVHGIGRTELKNVKKIFSIECEFKQPAEETFYCDGELWTVGPSSAETKPIRAKCKTFIEDDKLAATWCWQTSVQHFLSSAFVTKTKQGDDARLDIFFSPHTKIIDLPQRFIGARQEYAATRTWYFSLNNLSITAQTLRHLSACLKPDMRTLELLREYFVGRRLKVDGRETSAVERVVEDHIKLKRVSLTTYGGAGRKFLVSACRFRLFFASLEWKDLVLVFDTSVSQQDKSIIKLDGSAYAFESASLAALVASFNATEIYLNQDKCALRLKF